MSVPPLRLDNSFDPYISGKVIVHPSAVIAPGVILQAAPNGKIIIGFGVCIGMGSILKVEEGTLEIEANANLGAGFLMVGKGKIGASACIGSATTVFNCSVGPGQVIPPGSVLGDTSRTIEEFSSAATGEIKELPPSTTNPTQTSAPQQQREEDNVTEGKDIVDSESNSQASPTQQRETSIPESANNFSNQIYGQGSIQRLLTTLFPHRESLNNPHSDNKPE